DNGPLAKNRGGSLTAERRCSSDGAPSQPRDEIRSTMAKKKPSGPTSATFAERADREVNRLIGQLLGSVRRDNQAEIDALRAVHQVLAYHLGTVEQLIHHRFEEQSELPPAEVARLVLEEREAFFAKGVEHADHH